MSLKVKPQNDSQSPEEKKTMLRKRRPNKETEHLDKIPASQATSKSKFRLNSPSKAANALKKAVQ